MQWSKMLWVAAAPVIFTVLASGLITTATTKQQSVLGALQILYCVAVRVQGSIRPLFKKPKYS